jgi:preprotein translocase SecE subunit
MARNRQKARQRQEARRAQRRRNPYLEAPPEEEDDFPQEPADVTIDSEADTLARGQLTWSDDEFIEEVEPRSRGRVGAFLASVWAELQRVQWPDRQTVTLLTGIVLAFVLIAGGYLGLLDLIFSKLVQQIL